MRLKRNQAVDISVRLVDSNRQAITGATAPTVVIAKAGGTPYTKTITNGTNWQELGSAMPGRYRLSLTASDVDTLGVWDLEVKSGSSEPFTASHMIVASIEEDARAAAEFARKVAGNRAKMDAAAKTLTIYDDDKTTPLIVFDCTDEQGNASVLKVFERTPR